MAWLNDKTQGYFSRVVQCHQVQIPKKKEIGKLTELCVCVRERKRYLFIYSRGYPLHKLPREFYCQKIKYFRIEFDNSKPRVVIYIDDELFIEII